MTSADPTRQAPSSSVASPSPRRSNWLILRRWIRTDIAWLPVLAAGFFAAVLLLTFIVSRYRDIAVSGWDIAAQIPRWFIGGVGVYLTAVYVPLYIAHGHTRRAAARQLAVVAVLYTVVTAGLMALGYALEGFIYQAAGWTHELTADHLFGSSLASSGDYWLAVFEFTGVLLVWMVGGAMLGAGFYRNPAIGLGLIPVALVMASVTEAVFGPSMFDGISALLGLVGITATQTSAVVAVAASITWLLVRDIPMRSKAN